MIPYVKQDHPSPVNKTKICIFTIEQYHRSVKRRKLCIKRSGHDEHLSIADGNRYNLDSPNFDWEILPILKQRPNTRYQKHNVKCK